MIKPVKTSNFKWTPKRRLFVKVMPGEGFNATKSAKKAGYSKKTADKIGVELMSMPHIKRAIEKELDKALWKHEVSVDRVLQEWKIIGFQNIPDYMKRLSDGSIQLKPFGRMKKGSSRAIAGIIEDTWVTRSKGQESLIHRKVQYKFHDKLRALESMAKFLGMATQNINLSGELGLNHKFDGEELRKSHELLNGGRPKKSGTDKSRK